MKGINLSYAQYYKNKHRHIGHFWQDRYKSIIISKDDYLLACGSYVELNPVRARIVEDPKDYRWSSYNAYAHGKKTSLWMSIQSTKDYRKTKGEKKEIQGIRKGNDKGKGCDEGRDEQKGSIWE